MKKLLIACFYLLTYSNSQPLFAQPFNIVKEINTTATAGAITSSNFCLVNNVMYFSATDPVNGNELWKTDGTEAGTSLVKDIFPGTGGTIGVMTNYNGILLFVATDPTNGAELWRSDGTVGGTYLVKDIRSGTTGSNITQFINHNGIVLLCANDGISGQELWKTDGTATGTALLKDINTGSNSSISLGVAPYDFISMGGSLYFAASTSSNGKELWKTDGTSSGTIMVKDIWPGSGNGIFNHKAAVVNNILYFAGSNGLTINGIELWRTDGTDAGTYMVKDIVPGSTRSNPVNLINYNGVLYFSASTISTSNSELWKSDGTSAGTVMVKNLSDEGVRFTTGNNSSTDGFVILNNKLIFSTYLESSFVDYKLYTSDGSDAGTIPLKSFSFLGFNQNLGVTIFNNKLVFSAVDINGGSGLWETDGTVAGTTIIKDFISGNSNSVLGGSFVKLGSSLFFAANTEEFGGELWKTDGTGAGTVLVKDINTTKRGLPNFSSVFGSVVLNGNYYFTAADNVHGTELWKSDGTAAGTMMIKDIWPGKGSSGITEIWEINGLLYFSANDGINGNELWMSDGTESGTVMIADINPGPASSSPIRFTRGSNYVFFLATNDLYGNELWKTDGTVTGTSLVVDFVPGSSSSIMTDFESMNGDAFYILNNKLYKVNSDGSGVQELNPSINIATDLSTINNTLYFGGRTISNQTFLWKSDGSSAGTQQVKQLSSSSTNIYQLTNCNGKLYFSANNGSSGMEPWVSDGTETGTFLLKDIIPGLVGSDPFQFKASGSKVYFQAAATTANTDIEIWATDGTETGTYRVKDINPGILSSLPSGMISAPNNKVIFVANDGVNGIELWQSDGTETGTSLLQDFNSNGHGFFALSRTFNFSQDYLLTKLNNGIIFLAKDANKGIQLFYGKLESQKFYVNDNNTSGDVYTTAVGNNANSGTAAAPFATIQYAIDQAQPGDVIYIDAGLYAEDVIVNKSVVIKGAQAGINPGSLLTRGAETIVVPGTADPVNGTVFNIQKSDITIDGLTIDGDNPLISGSVILNGADINKGMAIARFINNTDAHNNLVFKNNIIRNVYRYGVFIQSTTGLPLSGNLVTQSHFDNIPALTVDGNSGRQGRAIGLANNGYTSVTQNVFTRVHTAVWMSTFNAAIQSNFDIANNTIECYRGGIILSGFSGTAAHYLISQNNVTKADLTTWDVPGASTTNFISGILVNTASSNAGMSLTNNTITNTYEGLSIGRLAPGNWIVSGNTVTGSTSIGLYYFSSSAVNPSMQFENNILQNNATGIYLHYLGAGGTMPVTFTNTPVTGGSVGMQIDGNLVSFPGNVLSGVSFTGQSGNYIQLTRNALDGQTIDASSVNFDGKNASAMTMAELFATEDKLAHKIDYDGVGFLKLKPRQIFITPNSFNTTLPNGWGTITTQVDLQRAISTSVNGDSIRVATGNYPTTNFSLSKGIAILGPNFTVSPNDPLNRLQPNSGRNAEAIISGATITISANDINFTGLTFDPGNQSAILLANSSGTNNNFGNFNFSKNIIRINSASAQLNIIGKFNSNNDMPVTDGYFIRNNRFEKQDELTAFGTTLRFNYIKNIEVSDNSFVVTGIKNKTQNAIDFGATGIVDLASVRNNFINESRLAFNSGRLATISITNNKIYNSDRGTYLINAMAESSNVEFSNNELSGTNGNSPFVFYSRTGGGAVGSTTQFKAENNSFYAQAGGLNNGTVFGSFNVTFGFNVQNPSLSINGNKIMYAGDFSNVESQYTRAIVMAGKLSQADISNNELTFTNSGTILPVPPTILLPENPGITIYTDNAGRHPIPAGSIINITNNKINGFKNSVVVYDPVNNNGLDSYTGFGNLPVGVITNIQNNSFTGNSMSVNNGEIGQPVNATCNWHGSAAAQNVLAKITPSTVNYIPWLTNGTDNDPAIGFQPVAGSCNGTIPVVTLDGSTNVSCFGGNNGTINITVSGGTSPYNFNWSRNGVSGFSTVEDPANLTAGTYSLIMTDANGSIASLNGIVITEPTLLTATATGTSTSCLNSASVAASGGTGIYTYLWSNGATTPSISSIPSGTYTVTVTDQNGCTAVASVTVTGNQAFNPSIAVTDALCYGTATGSLTVTNANGVAPYQYSLNGINFQESNVFNNLPAGTYTVTVKDALGCTGFNTKTVGQPTQLVVTLNSVQSTCFGVSTGSISTSASGGSPGFSYNWTGPNGYTASNSNISNLATGNYTLTVTDSKGCTASLQVFVPTSSQIILNSVVTNILCKGETNGSIINTVSGGSGAGFSYLWNSGATTKDRTNLGTGNYTLTVTDNGNGCSISSSFTITQPAIAINLSTSKSNATNCNLGNITVTGSGGTAPYTYSINGTVFVSSGVFNSVAAGTYTVWVKDANGCTKSAAVSITDNGGDDYESNNSKNQSKDIAIGTSINARIATATDVDWFKFTTPAGTNNYTVSLNHPNVAFTFALYASGNNTPALVPVSSTATTKVYSLAGNTTYYISIAGSATVNSFTCYTLMVTGQTLLTRGTNETIKEIAVDVPTMLKAVTYPNPHKGSFNLKISSPEEGIGTVTLYTASGQKISENKINLQKSDHNIIPYSGIIQGTIFYRIQIGIHIVNGKVVGIE